jgi:hypothetical protein
MDIVERLRNYVPQTVGGEWSHHEEAHNEAANEIERLREWIRHIGYYVSRNEANPTPTEKYIQKVCTSALKEGE